MWGSRAWRCEYGGELYENDVHHACKATQGECTLLGLPFWMEFGLLRDSNNRNRKEMMKEYEYTFSGRRRSPEA